MEKNKKRSRGLGWQRAKAGSIPHPLDFLLTNRQMPTHADTLQPANWPGLPSVEKKIQLQAYSDSHSNNQNSPIKGLFINYIIIRGGRARWTKIPHPSFPSVLLQVTRTWGGGAKNWQVISRGTGLSQKYLILLHSVAGFFCRKISLPIRRM